MKHIIKTYQTNYPVMVAATITPLYDDHDVSLSKQDARKMGYVVKFEMIIPDNCEVPSGWEQVEEDNQQSVIVEI